MKENIMKPTPIGFEKLLNKVAKTKKSDLDNAKKGSKGDKNGRKKSRN